MSKNLIIKGAKTHNLKNIRVSIPKNTLSVITGVSGSGKSSLAFDTLYAEGQKRYLESLSTYARMIISDTSDATKVDEIQGLSPTIAINQKTVSNNPRSTIGTITEIYDYYRLLYTHIGVPHCINHNTIVLKKTSLSQIYDSLEKIPLGEKYYVMFPFSIFENAREYINLKDISQKVSDNGFVRFMVGNQLYSIADNFEDTSPVEDVEDVSIVVDRLVKKKSEEYENRLKDTLRITSEKGNGYIEIYFVASGKKQKETLYASCKKCGYTLENLQISNFSFNSHYGACADCLGLGYRMTFDEKDIINGELTLLEGAILPWGDQKGYYSTILQSMCENKNISMDIPYKKLTKQQKEKVLYGVSEKFRVEFRLKNSKSKHISHIRYEGIIPHLERKYFDIEGKKDVYVKKLTQYATEKKCKSCQGYRIHPMYLQVTLGGKNIGELTGLSVQESRKFFEKIRLSENESKIAKEILKHIRDRLDFLQGVGLSYLTLDRKANTLSGGESQRIRLATQIGTKLEGIIYVLDEPSIGLHPRDNMMLISNLKHLSEIGNTVIVVEHDEDIMRESDYIVDIGPGAGVHGGEIIFSGTYKQLLQTSTQTAQYLSKQKIITRNNPKKPSIKNAIEIYGAKENNLKDVNVRIPLGCLTVVTGVSGSGKSSLVIDIVSNFLHNHFNRSKRKVGKHKKITGMSNIDKMILIDQSPIGRTPHSNIATYTGVFTFIREVFASSVDAKKRGFGPGHFSFNTKGGRCEICEGSGTKKIEMHFLPDVYVECESCKGTRYNQNTLDVFFKGKNIAEVLNMTIEEAAVFFKSFPRILRILDTLLDVGLGYITLGQSAPTLSGGESQRIKLAFDLAKRSTGKTLYILDEPTTGLHFSDIQKLLDILDRLVEKGNSVLVIEHNLDIIANSDAIIDIGPEGGKNGGQLLFSGPTKKIVSCEKSYTGQSLKKYWELQKKK
ncbi:excinuclease ABC subunit A [Candidatus Gracilibacteria bacterium]|nr:MAG: excinuclease ABC subunit A [Candidatus Gracilibacteria bacterium]